MKKWIFALYNPMWACKEEGRAIRELSGHPKADIMACGNVPPDSPDWFIEHVVEFTKQQRRKPSAIVIADYTRSMKIELCNEESWRRLISYAKDQKIPCVHVQRKKLSKKAHPETGHCPGPTSGSFVEWI